MRTILEDQVYKLNDLPEERSSSLVLLTRFNMYYPGLREKGGMSEREQFSKWTQSRMELFLRVCLPSIAAQSRQPDRWIIGADETTAELLKPLVEAAKRIPWITIAWQKIMDGAYERPSVTFSRSLKTHVEADTRDIVTCRVDNDDALNVDFCGSILAYGEMVKRRQPAPEDFWISFPIGMQFDGVCCRYYTHTRNHFLSRFQTRKAIQSTITCGALDGNHGKVFENKAVFLPITRYPMWMQYVHGENVSNTVTMSLPAMADTARELSRFSLSAKRFEKATAPAILEPKAG